MKKKLRILFVILLFIALIFINNNTKAVTTYYYNVNNESKIISEVEPETTIRQFKQKFLDGNVRIYKDSNFNEEIYEGFIGTGMFLKTDNDVFQISVLGDIDGDGQATKSDFIHIIKYMLGLEDYKLEGVNKISADFTADGILDEKDVSSGVEYIKTGKCEIYRDMKIDLQVVEKTTNRLKIEAKILNYDYFNNQNLQITYYIKLITEDDSEFVNIQDGSDYTLTLEDLNQNETYVVKVDIKDEAGNVYTHKTILTTEGIPSAELSDNIKFGTLLWNDDGKASTTISTDTNFYIEYQINSTLGEWIRNTELGGTITVEGINNGDILYARLTDGINSGNYKIMIIFDQQRGSQIVDNNLINSENTQTLPPEIKIEELNVNSNTIEIEVNNTNEENTTTLGLIYKFYIRKTDATDDDYREIQNSDSNYCGMTGLCMDTSYTIKAEAVDLLGNIGEDEIEITTEKLPDATEDDEVLTFSNINWETGSADIKIDTNTEYILEYQVNGIDGEWIRETQEGESVVVKNLYSRDVLFTRITDGTNSGDYASITIINNTTISNGDNINGNENITIDGNEPSYKNPVIPIGFKAIDNTIDGTIDNKAKWTNEDGYEFGLVIEDEQGNQFVWVPVKDINQYTRKSNVSNDLILISYLQANNDAYPNMIASEDEEKNMISKYGGFYVARYEAGRDNAIITLNTSNDSTSPNNTIDTPISQRGHKVWNYITYDNAVASAKQMVNNDKVQSGLITGLQWDAIMNWYEASEINVNETQDWGTYNNLPYDVNGKYFEYTIDNSNLIIKDWVNGKITHEASTNPVIYHASGLNEKGIKKNIADIGGNFGEYTAEYYYGGGYVTRRDSANSSISKDYQSTYRVHGAGSYGRSVNAPVDTSFRVVLYIK